MRKAFLLLTFLLLSTFTLVAAQPVETPLLRMLARIPDTSAARETFSYADYRALVAARPGAPTATSWAEFEALNDDEQALFISALQGLSSGSDFFQRYFMETGDMTGVVGFDLLNVVRAAAYGNPPASVTILEGEFDTDAVITAHEARGYSSEHQGDLTLLCGADGCENGMQTNLRDRNTANPFGGELGRSQPVLVGQRLVASSPSIDALNLVSSAITGDERNLLDQPAYRAAAEAITADGTLIQAYFVNSTDIAPAAEGLLLNSRLSAEQVKALTEQLQDEFVPLLQYNLIAFADTLTGSEQTTIIALVYTNHADAEASAALFPARLEEAMSFQTNALFGDMLKERGVTATDVAIYDASSNRSVLTISLRSPLPSAELADGERPQSISRVYSLLVRALFARDLSWLATQL